MREAGLPTVYVSLGSNLGDRARSLREAARRLHAGPNRVTACSHVYETEHVGDAELPQPDYLNAVLRLETSLTAHLLLRHTQAIERALGRAASPTVKPRTIDIDILLYDTLEISDEVLTIPHPRAALRRFVLQPLLELDPDIRFPNGRSARELLGDLPEDSQPVRPVTDFSWV